MENTIDVRRFDKIENAIQMLNKYTDEPSIRPLIPILEAMLQDTENEELVAQLTKMWRNLGIYQGTVLTYVPYFYTLIPDDIFGDDLKEY